MHLNFSTKPLKKLNSAFKDSINQDKLACEVRRFFPLNLGRPRLSWLNAIALVKFELTSVLCTTQFVPLLQHNKRKEKKSNFRFH